MFASGGGLDILALPSGNILVLEPFGALFTAGQRIPAGGIKTARALLQNVQQDQTSEPAKGVLSGGLVRRLALTLGVLLLYPFGITDSESLFPIIPLRLARSLPHTFLQLLAVGR